MLAEMLRVASPTAGLIASVSFASIARMRLLQEWATSAGAQLRVHVVGKGDPAHGHEVSKAEGRHV